MPITPEDQRRFIAARTDPGRSQTLLPDWLIIGVPHTDYVMVYASSKLPSVQLKQAVRGFEEQNRDRIDSGELEPTPWSLTARMMGIVTGRGRTYAEAMADLAVQWNPDEGGSTEARQQRVSRAEMAQLTESSPAPAAEPDEDIVDAEVIDE